MSIIGKLKRKIYDTLNCGIVFNYDRFIRGGSNRNWVRSSS